MKNLVVIGGGFAGAKIARKLENKFNVTLIDHKDYFEFTPGILRSIIFPEHLKKIQVQHKSYLKNSKVIKGCVTEISEKEVKINNKEIKFDYLIIASGSTYNFPFKEKDVIIATRGKHLIQSHKELEKAENITIIGGGLVGIELAAEIREHYKNKKITIIHSSNRLIPRNNEKSSRIAEQFLRKNNVKIIYNEKAENKDKKHIVTSSRKKILSDLTFLCTGISPNSDFMEKNFSNYLDSKKQIIINKNLQVKENIFAAGDVTNIFEEKTAQNAEKHASIVIQNIINLEEKKLLKEYKSKKNVMIISLGKHNGILEYNSFVISGFIIGMLKSLVEWKTMMRYK